MTDYTLWGSHPSYADGAWIKLSGGSVEECYAEYRTRTAQGWTDLEVVPTGEAPARWAR